MTSVRRKLALALGIAAAVAVARWLRRRGSVGGADGVGDPRTRALRAKLADSRLGEPLGEPAGAPGGEPEAAGVERVLPGGHPGRTRSAAHAASGEEEQDAGVEEARRRVHEQARAALEEMRRSGDS